MINSAVVSFKDHKGYGKNKYTYKVLSTQQDIKAGGVAVVDSPYGGLVTVDVISVSEEVSGTAYIVDVVDTDSYERTKAKEKQIAQIKKELTKARKNVEEKMVWKALASESTEIASLLAALESAEKGV